MKKSYFSFLLFLFFSFFSVITVSANSTKQYNGVPDKLVNKYWKVKNGFNDHTEFFYGNRDSYFGKHTRMGNFKSKWISYTKVQGSYVMTGTDPFDEDQVIWWFIKPVNNWKQIKIGYTIVSFNKIPQYSPSHYTKKLATRVTKVTAMLY
ncbi:hypothetical protein PL11_004335 [Lentilactobacillus curieae]|uniref:Uncharacterized protein n=1 Tax=Lentilactobacillus curieae TaxID=1138822 RepID=A0A1S6QHW4_9LACO|nr:hypothetical protein [Lentilactobacillus curieae]AQW21205.1 hypothetical protein PL11_004335 [Lentilactobacillus curieae]